MNSTTIQPIHACEKFFKSGRIQPLNFNFPAFSIDDRTFKHFSLDAVEEKFKMAETSPGMYDQKALSSLTVTTDPRYGEQAKDITKKTLSSAMSFLAQSNMSKLSNEGATIALQSTGDQIGFIHKKDEFAATLLMIKHSFSDKTAYNQVMDSLELHQDQDLFKDIKKMVNNPPFPVVSHIYKLDPKMAMENFPQQSKEILNLEKPILGLDGSKFSKP